VVDQQAPRWGDAAALTMKMAAMVSPFPRGQANSECHVPVAGGQPFTVRGRGAEQRWVQRRAALTGQNGTVTRKGLRGNTARLLGLPDRKPGSSDQ